MKYPDIAASRGESAMLARTKKSKFDGLRATGQASELEADAAPMQPAEITMANPKHFRISGGLRDSCNILNDSLSYSRPVTTSTNSTIRTRPKPPLG